MAAAGQVSLHALHHPDVIGNGTSIMKEENLDHSAKHHSPDTGDELLNSRSPTQQSPKWTKYGLRRAPWRPRTTSFSRIVAARYRGAGTPEDPFIVQWLNDDPENPKDYGDRFKWLMTVLSVFTAFCLTLASSAYTGALQLVTSEFGCSSEVFLLGLSSMVLGFALGPLLWAPLSEAFGRRNVLSLALLFYILWTALCAAAQNISTLIVFRLLSGCFGSVCLVVPVGQLSDMFEAEQRGIAQAVYAAAPFLGSTLGPAVGGFLSAAAGWRWLMGFLALYAATVSCLTIFLVPETYAPVLLRRRAQALSKATGNSYVTQIDFEQPLGLKKLVWRSFSRPWALLFREPIVLLLSIYVGVVYGILYLFFAAFPIVFQQGYGWNAGQEGLAFSGVMVGIIAGVVMIILDNKRYSRIQKAHCGFAPPEARLPPVILGGVLAIVGLAWFAATVNPRIHFLVPIIAGFPFGTGFILIYMCCSNYLIDSYVIYSASVLASNTMLRSAFGAIFPLFATYMYENLGLHWASAVPGFISLACFPFPIFFYKYGEKIRRRCKYSAEAARLLDALKSDHEGRD